MKHIIFDWGDTIMRDDPARTDAMYLWPQLEMVAGAEQALTSLGQKAHLALATNAALSDEQMIRKALARVGVDHHFRSIFCAATLGRKKTDPAFWLHVLGKLEAQPEDVMVIGDSFAGDVATPSSVGLHAIWLNRLTTEVRRGDRYHTIHHLAELLDEAKLTH